MAARFHEALASASKDDGLTPLDQAHLRRWAVDWADDPLWERLSVAARAREMMPSDATDLDIHLAIIREALFMRRHAESVASGTDMGLRERQQQRQRYLELAKKADDLADYYEWTRAYSGIADFFGRFLMPAAELQNLHRSEAALLRQLAGSRPLKSAARVSRQDRRGRRTGLRKINAFIDLADSFVKTWLTGQPDHEAVALLTEIAFPGHDIDPEYVRTSLRPSTSGGRRGSRAFAMEKS